MSLKAMHEEQKETRTSEVVTNGPKVQMNSSISPLEKMGQYSNRLEQDANIMSRKKDEFYQAGGMRYVQYGDQSCSVSMAGVWNNILKYFYNPENATSFLQKQKSGFGKKLNDGR